VECGLCRTGSASQSFIHCCVFIHWLLSSCTTLGGYYENAGGLRGKLRRRILFSWLECPPFFRVAASAASVIYETTHLSNQSSSQYGRDPGTTSTNLKWAIRASIHVLRRGGGEFEHTIAPWENFAFIWGPSGRASTIRVGVGLYRGKHSHKYPSFHSKCNTAS